MFSEETYLIWTLKFSSTQSTYSPWAHKWICCHAFLLFVKIQKLFMLYLNQGRVGCLIVDQLAGVWAHPVLRNNVQFMLRDSLMKEMLRWMNVHLFPIYMAYGKSIWCRQEHIEYMRKNVHLVPIYRQGSCSPCRELFLVCTAKLFIFKINIEVPEYDKDKKERLKIDFAHHANFL